MRIFVSYSHKDVKARERLITHITPLIDSGHIELWDDQQIEAGEDWKHAIQEALNRAEMAILLISANFLASKHCTKLEISQFFQARTERGLRIVPIILSACLWEHHPWIPKLQALPMAGKKPVDQFKNRAEVWTDICRRIGGLLGLQSQSVTLGNNAQFTTSVESRSDEYPLLVEKLDRPVAKDFAQRSSLEINPRMLVKDQISTNSQKESDINSINIEVDLSTGVSFNILRSIGHRQRSSDRNRWPYWHFYSQLVGGKTAGYNRMLELVNKDNLLHLNAYPWLITQNGRSVENPVKISISSKLLYYPYGEEHGVYFIITFPVILADRVIMEISPEGMEDRRVYLQFSLSNSQKTK